MHIYKYNKKKNQRKFKTFKNICMIKNIFCCDLFLNCRTLSTNNVEVKREKLVSINQRFSMSSIEILLFPVDGLIVLAEALFHDIDCCQGNGMFISYRRDRDYVNSH